MKRNVVLSGGSCGRQREGDRERETGANPRGKTDEHEYIAATWYERKKPLRITHSPKNSLQISNRKSIRGQAGPLSQLQSQMLLQAQAFIAELHVAA